MALPETKVEIAWDSGFATPEGSRTWTDVSTYVEGNEAITITYARSDEVSAADPNKATVTLDNRDGRFTPERTSSPYYPNVTKGKPLRVSVRYNGVWYVRFTGYVDEWPLVWPDASSAAATITVSASSRRARLGLTAPLPSAIRAAYLATSPDAYWPMNEDAEQMSASGQQVFRDLTNADLVFAGAKQLIAAFSTTEALKPVVRDGSIGPTDEESLVRIPTSTNIADLFAFTKYIGSGNTIKINTAGEATVEAVMRYVPTTTNKQNVGTIFYVASADQNQAIRYVISSDGDTGSLRGMGATLEYTADDTGAVIPGTITSLDAPPQYAEAVDGEIHHYAITLSGGNTVKTYFDGALLFTDTLTGGYTYSRPFTNLAFGTDTYNSTMWIGHGAIHNRALTAGEMATRAAAATAASETVEERVKRLAGYLDVPLAEVDVEATVAAPLGPEPESGRGATEIIDEIATSTNGVAYDTRAGHLAVAARNHRYNVATSFTLDATTQEVDGSLLPTLDDHFLTNSVIVSRTGADLIARTLSSQTSIDQNGLYQKTVEIVSSSDQEAEAAGLNLLSRYATPRVRISEVAVDLVNLSTPQCAAVLTADVGTKFALSGLPTQAPTSTMTMFLEGYTETITDSSHTLAMNTSPGDMDAAWILGSATLGVLGSTTIVAY